MSTAVASPYKSTAEELAALRKTFRQVCRCYMERVESQIACIQERVLAAGAVGQGSEVERAKVKLGTGQAAEKPATGRTALANSEIHDLRDMLTLLRMLEIKPEAGRRKDLKKIESLVDDLRTLSERWG